MAKNKLPKGNAFSGVEGMKDIDEINKEYAHKKLPFGVTYTGVAK